MSVTVDFSPDGSARLVSDKPVPAGSSLSVGLKDLATDRYLSPTGWVGSREVLPNATSENGVLSIPLEPAVAAMIETDAKLSLDDSSIDFRDDFSWPARPAPAEATPVTEAKSSPEAASPAVTASDIPSPSEPPITVVADTKRSRAGYGLVAAGMVAGLAIGAAFFHVYPTDRLLAAAGLPASRALPQISDESVAALQKREGIVTEAEARLSKAEAELKGQQADLSAAKASVQKTADDTALLLTNETKRLEAENADLEREKSEVAAAKVALQKEKEDTTSREKTESARLAAATAEIEREKTEVAKSRAELQKAVEEAKNQTAATELKANTAADAESARLAAAAAEIEREKAELSKSRAELQKAAEDAKNQAAAAESKSKDAADAEIRLTAVRRSLENAQATIRDKDQQLRESAQRLEEALKKNISVDNAAGAASASVLLKTAPATLTEQLATRGVPDLLLDKTQPTTVFTPVPSLLGDDGERGLAPVKDSLANQRQQDIAAVPVENQQLSATIAERDDLKATSETLQKAVADLKAQLAGADSTNSELRSKVAALEKTAVRDEAVPGQNQKISSLTVERDNLKITSETLRKSVADLTAQLQGETNINTELRARVATLEKKASAEDDVTDQKKQISVIAAERDSLKTAADALQKSVADIKTQLENANGVNAELRTEIATLTKKTSARGLSVEQDVKISALAAERDNLKTASDELSKSVTDMKAQLDSANSVNSELRNSIAALEKKVAESALVASNDANQRSIGDPETPELKSQIEQLETTTRDQAEKLKQATEQLAARPETRSIWGAVALGQDGLFQTIVNQTSEKAAVDLAMKLCQGQSGDGCTLQQSFNNKCFSLARVSDERFGDWAWATRPNREIAERAAIQNCEKAHDTGCSIRISTCTPDSLER